MKFSFLHITCEERSQKENVVLLTCHHERQVETQCQVWKLATEAQIVSLDHGIR